MTPRTWCSALGIVSVLGGLGLVIGLDRSFKAEVSDSESDSGIRAVAVADNGFLHWRRSLFLQCVRGGSICLAVKARLAEREWLRARSTERATIFIQDGARRGADFARGILLELETRMTLMSAGWVDALRSDDLSEENAMRFGDVIAKSSATDIFIATMERGTRFDVNGGRADMKSFIRDCIALGSPNT